MRSPVAIGAGTARSRASRTPVAGWPDRSTPGCTARIRGTPPSSGERLRFHSASPETGTPCSTVAGGTGWRHRAFAARSSTPASRGCRSRAARRDLHPSRDAVSRRDVRGDLEGERCARTLDVEGDTGVAAEGDDVAHDAMDRVLVLAARRAAAAVHHHVRFRHQPVPPRRLARSAPRARTPDRRRPSGARSFAPGSSWRATTPGRRCGGR